MSAKQLRWHRAAPFLLFVALCCVASARGIFADPVAVERPEIDEHRIGRRLYIREKYGEFIELKVVVDSQGAVESAVAVSGPKQFWQQAETLEKGQRFKPFQRDGQPVTASLIDVVFLAAQEDWKSPRVPFPEVRDWSTLHIRLERKGVYYQPSYSVELSGNGEIKYQSQQFDWGVLVAGHHRDFISKESVAHLVSVLRASDYFSLRDVYESPHLSESPTYTMSIEFDGRKEEVLDRGNPVSGMPELVTYLEDQIDEVAGTARWVIGNSDTVPSLLREHWISGRILPTTTSSFSRQRLGPRSLGCL